MKEAFQLDCFSLWKNCAVKCVVTPKEDVRSQLEFGNIQNRNSQGKSGTETTASG